jgi:hypothetical protein
LKNVIERYQNASNIFKLDFDISFDTYNISKKQISYIEKQLTYKSLKKDLKILHCYENETIQMKDLLIIQNILKQLSSHCNSTHFFYFNILNTNLFKTVIYTQCINSDLFNYGANVCWSNGLFYLNISYDLKIIMTSLEKSDLNNFLDMTII